MFKWIGLWLLLGVGNVLKGQQLDLARAYVNQQELEKAEQEYQKVIRDKNQAVEVHQEYVQLLTRLKKKKELEKFLRGQIKHFPGRLTYQADLEVCLLDQNRVEEAKAVQMAYFAQAYMKDHLVFELQNKFYTQGRFDAMIQLLQEAEIAQKSPLKFGIQLSRAYLFAGDKANMLKTLLSWGITNGQTDYVRQQIGDQFKDQKELELAEKILYEHVQEAPQEIFYTETLIWFFIQQKEFRRAFVQARGLDKRLQLGGRNVFDLGMVAYQNKDFAQAVTIFDYLLKEYPQGNLRPIAQLWKIQSKEESIKIQYPVEEKEIQSLVAEYEDLLSRYGQHPSTGDVRRNLALLRAFYLNQKDQAIDLLEQAVTLSQNNPKFRDQCKIDLGDIYLLKGEPWEATLLYMQVEKSQKEEVLGEMAKLKNAQLHYYSGEFELAQELLSILKKATSREIANDAMKLGMLILDNTGLDSSTTALQAYATAELLIYQRKWREALVTLDSLKQSEPENPLQDDVLFLKAEIHSRLGEWNQAVESLQLIVDNYSFDILIDDAWMKLAEIHEGPLANANKAMEIYEKILKDFPGSVFAAQARKKFRELRGDTKGLL